MTHRNPIVRVRKTPDGWVITPKTTWPNKYHFPDGPESLITSISSTEYHTAVWEAHRIATAAGEAECRSALAWLQDLCSKWNNASPSYTGGLL